jgi:hypothetical protein
MHTPPQPALRPLYRFAAWLALLCLVLQTGGCANMTPGQKAALAGGGIATLRVVTGVLLHEDPRSFVPDAIRLGTTAALIAYVVTKRHATEYEMRVAVVRARAYEARERRTTLARSKAPATPKPHSRYVAVDTPRSAGAQGTASIMIWDTEAHALVSTEVYDLQARPELARVSTFEKYKAEYVADGH